MASSSTSTDDGADRPVTPADVDLDALTTKSLKNLQSMDERRLLDVVDKLRRIGLNGTIELPQLVVCGDQSSGKSSVLEAITEIPFPRKAGLCTRFATEIVLRRQPTSSVTIKINPSKTRDEADKARLSAFDKTISELSELPQVIEDATQVMGLGKVGESKAFSRDVLSVEICGPDRPQLTLVDLPGLIHSATKSQTDADKELIFSLVQWYMKNPRTIILAVVSARNDAANQIILDLFKKIDKKGSRTLGIITKPDCMSAGEEQFWFDLALNKEVFLERGWHMVKNRAESETTSTFQERNDAEEAFFSKERFKDLPRQSVGIAALRVRLSNLLLRHLIQELPALKKEMKEKLLSTATELASLGEKRETSQEQRMMLTTMSMKINQVIMAAVDGHYSHAFFESVNMNRPITNGQNVRRFRAVVQELNHAFAESMRMCGHTYAVEHEDEVPHEAPSLLDPPMSVSNSDSDSSSVVGTGDLFGKDEESDGDVPRAKKMTHDEAMKWVKNMIVRCRGHELPGGVNPEVTSHLFWEQSKPWKDLAEDHIESVRANCKYFIQQVLEYSAPAEFKKPLEDLVVNDVLDETLKDAQQELKKLLGDKARHPSTYNHYYTDILQKRRNEKLKTATAEARKKATITNWTKMGNVSSFDEEKFQKEMTKVVEQDMATFAAEEALESQRAIYKDKMKYFVQAITEQVIERCMISPLPSKILSPVVVQSMSDEEVALVAAEPPETVEQRAFLEERNAMLEKGFEIFREAMGGVKRGRGGR